MRGGPMNALNALQLINLPQQPGKIILLKWVIHRKIFRIRGLILIYYLSQQHNFFITTIIQIPYLGQYINQRTLFGQSSSLRNDTVSAKLTTPSLDSNKSPIFRIISGLNL